MGERYVDLPEDLAAAASSTQPMAVTLMFSCVRAASTCAVAAGRTVSNRLPEPSKPRGLAPSTRQT